MYRGVRADNKGGVESLQRELSYPVPFSAPENIIHFGGSPYIRGRASRFNSLLFRTFVIIRVAWDSVKPFPVRRESAHIIETMTIHLRENENF
jgi:hypothetical protein